VYAGQGQFVGEYIRHSVLKRRVAGSGAFATVGDAAATVFQSGGCFKDLTLDGGAATNGDTLLAYDMARVTVYNTRFKGGAVGAHMMGGITVTFVGCTFDLADIGIKCEKFASAAGGGYPNVIKLISGHVVDNFTLGAWFDYGQHFGLDGMVQFERNGTTYNDPDEGAIYIGPNIGENIFGTDSLVPGLMSNGTYFESNKGQSCVELHYGLNRIENSQVFQNAAETLYDFRIFGGRHHLDFVNFSHFKAGNNVKEESGVVEGNTLDNIDPAGITIDPLKTSLNLGNRYLMRGGEVPAVVGIAKPMVLTGTDATGTNPTITFSPAFKTGTTPTIISLKAVDSGTSYINAPDPYDITATSFKLRKKATADASGGVISYINYTVQWAVLGEAP
jgi:hypothetical protein